MRNCISQSKKYRMRKMKINRHVRDYLETVSGIAESHYRISNVTGHEELYHTPTFSLRYEIRKSRTPQTQYPNRSENLFAVNSSNSPYRIRVWTCVIAVNEFLWSVKPIINLFEKRRQKQPKELYSHLPVQRWKTFLTVTIWNWIISFSTVLENTTVRFEV